MSPYGQKGPGGSGVRDMGGRGRGSRASNRNPTTHKKYTHDYVMRLAVLGHTPPPRFNSQYAIGRRHSFSYEFIYFFCYFIKTSQHSFRIDSISWINVSLIKFVLNLLFCFLEQRGCRPRPRTTTTCRWRWSRSASARARSSFCAESTTPCRGRSNPPSTIRPIWGHRSTNGRRALTARVSSCITWPRKFTNQNRARGTCAVFWEKSGESR